MRSPLLSLDSECGSFLTLREIAAYAQILGVLHLAVSAFSFLPYFDYAIKFVCKYRKSVLYMIAKSNVLRHIFYILVVAEESLRLRADTFLVLRYMDCKVGGFVVCIPVLWSIYE